MDPEISSRLQELLSEADTILWEVIYAGGFPTEAMAQAAFDGHKAVKKARSLVEERLSQTQMQG